MIALLPYSPTIHTAMQGAFLAVLVIAIWAASKAFRVYPETVAAFIAGFIALVLWMGTNNATNYEGELQFVYGRMWGAVIVVVGCLVIYGVRKIIKR